MEDLMARTIVENLAIGINPLTGEVLNQSDVCSSGGDSNGPGQLYAGVLCNGTP